MLFSEESPLEIFRDFIYELWSWLFHPCEECETDSIPKFPADAVDNNPNFFHFETHTRYRGGDRQNRAKKKPGELSRLFLKTLPIFKTI
jgi:hypothetical protein